MIESASINLVSILHEESNLDVSSVSMQGCNTDGDTLITDEPRNKLVGSGARQKKHEKSRSKSKAQKNISSTKLERHTMSLWLASAFAIASIFIWAITCTLSYKPVQFETYFDTIGRFSRGQFEQNERWRRLSRVGLRFSALWVCRSRLPYVRGRSLCTVNGLRTKGSLRYLCDRRSCWLIRAGWIWTHGWISLVLWVEGFTARFWSCRCCFAR